MSGGRPILTPLQASPGQGCASPYFNNGTEHIHRSHPMWDLSHMALTAETTDSADHLSPHPPRQSNIVDVVPPNYEPVEPLSPRTPHCGEARVRIRLWLLPCDSPRIPPSIVIAESLRATTGSTTRLGQRPKDFRAEALDLVGSDFVGSRRARRSLSYRRASKFLNQRPVARLR